MLEDRAESLKFLMIISIVPYVICEVRVFSGQELVVAYISGDDVSVRNA